MEAADGSRQPISALVVTSMATENQWDAPLGGPPAAGDFRGVGVAPCTADKGGAGGNIKSLGVVDNSG